MGIGFRRQHNHWGPSSLSSFPGMWRDFTLAMVLGLQRICMEPISSQLYIFVRLGPSHSFEPPYYFRSSCRQYACVHANNAPLLQGACNESNEEMTS